MKNKLSFVGKFFVLGFLGKLFALIVIFMSLSSYFLAENWMSFEDFLQHCSTKHRSYRSNHWQGRAMYRVLDGNCRLAEDGE